MSTVCHHCGAASNESDRFCRRCGAAVVGDRAAQPDPLVGRTVGGRYNLQQLVGVGGMGRVYRAEQTALGRTVALKVIHPHLLGDEQTVSRFYTEARASSRLNHPNSVSIIDFGRADDGILYLVMEFLEGKDLAMVMHEEGPLPFGRISEGLVAVLGALGEAHALGVVHRDLKPENIIINRMRMGGDLVKVVDFGLATIVSGPDATAITTPGLVCGTPDYMSPEQGKGEQVDGRGDLYALGVVLFELLTDELPYEDETPTKVVLRHINDAIPDPLVVAPQRDIPPELAAVAVKALAKRAEDRYQTAEEMADALRRAMTAQGSRVSQPASGSVSCRACGADNPPVQRFCGSCGARMSVTFTAPVKAQSPPPSRPSFLPPVTDSPLVGRADELSRIRGLLSEASAGPVRLHISGEPGTGKTRLLKEVSKLAEEQGDVVVSATPHPLRAPVPYVAARALLAALLRVEVEGLRDLAGQQGAFAEPMVRAGVAEAAAPQGLTGYEDRGRTGAVAAALAMAVRVAAGRAASGRVLLIVDDLDAVDGLSRDVVESLASLADCPCLVATADHAPFARRPGVHAMSLHGLDSVAARRLIGAGGEGSDPPSLASTTRLFLPLYLEQVQALGAGLGPDNSLPPRLADAVGQRLDRLDLSARRVIQAAAVLGDRCALDWLQELTDADDIGGGLQTLHELQLARLTPDGVEFRHPFVRDLVEMSIPAEARRALHERALQLGSARDAPLEVRAEHAYRAGEPMSALMILERMGDVARRHGDARAAVTAYSRALELARRELLETGDFMLEGAIVTFSRKLGEALERSDDVTGADGVLREALDLAGPHSVERARMLLALGRVASRRERPRDAVRMLRQALEISISQRAPVVEAQVQIAMARLRREDGDDVGAANAYKRALEGLPADAEPVVRARTLVQVGEVLVQIGDLDAAVDHLGEASLLAEGNGAAALVAAATGVLGAVDAAAGRPERATARYRDAARLAAEAGDATGHTRWRGAADSLG